MIESSIVGVVKTIIFIIGIAVIMKFIGRLLIMKRNLKQENDFLKEKKEEQKLKQFINKNLGKVDINKNDCNNKHEDVDFEDLS